MQVEVDGIPLVARGRHQVALQGVTIDEQEMWGRKGLVVYRQGVGGGC